MAHIRLHLRQADGQLPMVCMRCGAPASVVKAKKMSYYPRGLLLLVILGGFGLILLLILALALRKRALLRAPFCEQHEGHWTMRSVVMWTATLLMIVICVGSVIGFIAFENGVAQRQLADVLGPLLCMGSIVVFVGWLVMAIVLQNTTIRPDEITRTHILLNGVADEFVTAVEDAEIERRVRLRQWEVEDEAESLPHADDELTSRRKPPTTDAFEADERHRGAPPPDTFKA